MDKIQEKRLRMLVQSEFWSSIEPFMEILIKKWNDVPVKGESEFETIYNLAAKEGKIEGVREFIRSIEEISCQ